MKNKYQAISALSQKIKGLEIDLCWELRGFRGNPRPVAKARREAVRELACVK
jgi:hypothetical protein